jgi:hypothetical protein
MPGTEIIDHFAATAPTVMARTRLHKAGHDDGAVLIVGESEPTAVGIRQKPRPQPLQPMASVLGFHRFWGLPGAKARAPQQQPRNLPLPIA